jgi:hypothetical protein
MTDDYRYRYLRLPVDPDEGFPQAFRLILGRGAYTIRLYPTITDDAVLRAGKPLTLPCSEAFLVMTVTREGPGPARTILRRKLVPAHEYEADELAFVFRTMVLDPRNLNRAGAFGSQIEAGVTARWAV